MERIPNIFMRDSVIQRLSKVAKVGALNETERKAYDASLKQYRDNYAISQAALIEGRAEGIAIGRAERIALGRVEGRDDGIEQATMKFIKNCLSQGLDLNLISQLVGVSADKIQEIASH